MNYLIYICANQESIIQLSINNWKILQENWYKLELLNFKMANTKLISNTQRYKCSGNGMTVAVIAHILKQIKEKN